MDLLFDGVHCCRAPTVDRSRLLPTPFKIIESVVGLTPNPDAWGDQLGHVLTAAGHRRAGRVNHAYEVAADVTAEETGFTSHDEVPP